MKRSLFVVLAMAFVLSTTGTSYAADPFVDVAANHWAYKAVMELSKAGVVDGMGDGTFQGGKTITRYEIAQIVAKAMAKNVKLDSKCRANLQMLQTEFAAEIQSLGVKVDGLKTQIDNMPKISGEVRVRFQKGYFKYSNDGVIAEKGICTQARSRITLTGNINENWTYKGRFQNTLDMRTSSTDDNLAQNLAWVEGKVSSVKLQLGRFAYTPAYGLINYGSMKGVSVKGGNDVNYGVYYGSPDTNEWLTESGYRLAPALSATSTVGVEVGAKLGSNLNAKAEFFKNKSDNGDVVKYLEIGADCKIANDWNLKAAYAKSDVDAENKAHFFGVKFKGSDKQKPGSFGVDFSYQRRQLNAVYDSILDVEPGFKGYKLGIDYTIDKNIQVIGTCIDEKRLEVISGGTDEAKRRVYRTELFFYF